MGVGHGYYGNITDHYCMGWRLKKTLKYCETILSSVETTRYIN